MGFRISGLKKRQPAVAPRLGSPAIRIDNIRDEVAFALHMAYAPPEVHPGIHSNCIIQSRGIAVHRYGAQWNAIQIGRSRGPFAKIPSTSPREVSGDASSPPQPPAGPPPPPEPEVVPAQQPPPPPPADEPAPPQTDVDSGATSSGWSQWHGSSRRWTTSSWWSQWHSSTSGWSQRRLARAANHRAEIAAGRQPDASQPSGPQLVGQGCQRCDGRRHFAFRCNRKLCGVCCRTDPSGPCGWHAANSAAAAANLP